MKNLTLKQLFLQTNGYFTGIIQLSLPLGIYLGIQSGAGWGWWITCLFFYVVVYSIIGNNIGLHKYFTHRQFEVKKPIEWLFAWTGTMSCLGDPVSYSMSHLIHHQNSDGPLDIHGPNRGLKSILTFFYRRPGADEPVPLRSIAWMIKPYGWLHKYTTPFILLNALVMYLISYELFLFCWLIPASATAWGVAAAVITQHWDGYPNNGWHHPWFIYYDALHKNHHDHPRSPNNAFDKGQIDYSYQYSKIFFPKYNWQFQPGHPNYIKANIKNK